MNYVARLQKSKSMTGAQKSAIMFLCMGEEHGGALMQQLESDEIRAITKAISDMGEIPSDLVDDVMEEFQSKIADVGGVIGSAEAAKSILGRFLPEDRVAAILKEIESGQSGDIWEDISAMDEQALSEFLQQEHNQTVAVILTKLTSDISAKILSFMEQGRMVEIVERMASISDLPNDVVENIEAGLRQDLLGADKNNIETEIEKHMVNIFNKLDADLIKRMSGDLQKKIPDKFQAIKNQMFVFEDLINFKPNVLALIMRDAGQKTLPLALRGAGKETRDHFLNSLPQRSRDMLQDEMKSMGPVRSRDVKDAQSELVDITIRLAAEGQIEMPTEDTSEEMIE